jgi:hypothetical protein
MLCMFMLNLFMGIWLPTCHECLLLHACMFHCILLYCACILLSSVPPWGTLSVGIVEIWPLGAGI